MHRQVTDVIAPRSVSGHATSRIPLWLKIAWTAWLLVWGPVYWKHYGTQNFLYFCDLGNFLIAVALWMGHPEVPADVLGRVGALLVADDDGRPATDPEDARDDGRRCFYILQHLDHHEVRRQRQVRHVRQQEQEAALIASSTTPSPKSTCAASRGRTEGRGDRSRHDLERAE